MSAWRCSDTMLSVLADTLVVLGVTDKDKDEVFAMLKEQNDLSLSSRYGDPVAEDYEGYRRDTPELRPEDLFMLASSYGYQSCEHDGWNTSIPTMWIDTVQTRIAAEWQLDLDAAHRRAHEAGGLWWLEDPDPLAEAG